MRGTRRRTHAAGAFPDGQSALVLVAVGLRHAAGSEWSTTHRNMNMEKPKELERSIAQPPSAQGHVLWTAGVNKPSEIWAAIKKV